MKKVVSLHSQSRDGLVAQLDRVPDYGSGGCGFDSRLVHLTDRKTRSVFLSQKTSETTLFETKYFLPLHAITLIFKEMKHIVKIFAALIILQACTGSDYKIEGTLPEQINADSVYLYLFPDETPSNSAAVVEHNFVMTGSIESPAIAQLSLKDKRTVWSFIAESGTIKLVPESNHASGTHLNEDYVRWQNDIDSIVKACGRDEDSIIMVLPTYFEENWAKNRNDIVGASILLYCFDILGFDNVKAYYGQIGSGIENDTIVKMLKKRIDIVDNTSVGHKAPDANLHTIDGEDVSLLSLLEKDKYTLIDCWASWCMPCRMALPTIKEVAAKYPEMNIVGIAINDNPNKTVEAIANEGITWNVVLDPRADFAKDYNIMTIPAFILVNGDGVIVERYFNIDELGSRVAKHLGER